MKQLSNQTDWTCTMNEKNWMDKRGRKKGIMEQAKEKQINEIDWPRDETARNLYCCNNVENENRGRIQDEIESAWQFAKLRMRGVIYWSQVTKGTCRVANIETTRRKSRLERLESKMLLAVGGESRRITLGEVPPAKTEQELEPAQDVAAQFLPEPRAPVPRPRAKRSANRKSRRRRITIVAGSFIIISFTSSIKNTFFSNFSILFTFKKSFCSTIFQDYLVFESRFWNVL